jgi:hypothetical protein
MRTWSECDFLSANMYARSLFGEDALANPSIEQTESGTVIGHVRIWSKKTDTFWQDWCFWGLQALWLGDLLCMVSVRLPMIQSVISLFNTSTIGLISFPQDSDYPTWTPRKPFGMNPDSTQASTSTHISTYPTCNHPPTHFIPIT